MNPEQKKLLPQKAQIVFPLAAQATKLKEKTRKKKFFFKSHNFGIVASSNFSEP